MSDLMQLGSMDAKTRLSDLLNELTTSIKNVHPDSTVILFGSYAKGDAHEDSDLDICVLVSELTQRRIDMNVELRGLIGNMCYDYNMPFDIKLYTYNEFEQESIYKSSLQHTIKTEGVELGLKYAKRVLEQVK
jgi:predicted nucleotidyltransferase